MSGMTFWIVLLGSNLGCVCLGFLFGRLTRAAVEVEQHMTDSPEDSPPSNPHGRRGPTPMMLVALAVVFIGVVTAVVGFNVTRNQDRLTGCVVGYSNSLADALDRRAASQRQVNEQLDSVMRAIRDAFGQAPATGRQNVLDAVEDYVAARERAKEAQQDNPLPESPRDACAELLD